MNCSKGIVCFLLLFPSVALGQTGAVSIASTPFHPVNVQLALTLTETETEARTFAAFPLTQPALAIWNWGEGKRPVDHSDIAWPDGKLVQTVTHVYDKPGEYSVMVTLVDRKHRFILQRSERIRVSASYEIIDRLTTKP